MGQPLALTQKSQPLDIAVDEKYVYWSAYDNSQVPTNGLGGTGQILRCEKADCAAPVVIVNGLYLPTSVATDGTKVYWSESAEAACCSVGSDIGCCNGLTDVGRIASCPVGGCDTPTPLVEHVSSGSNLVVDGWNVYFATSDAVSGTGRILRVPK